MDTKLYVGNLPYTTNEAELEAMFAQAGTVKSVMIIYDRDTGRSKGFGFVEMEGKDDVDKAISMYDGKDMGGRALTVNIARPKDDRGGFGGGGGGGRPGGGGGGYGGGGGGSFGGGRGGGGGRSGGGGRDGGGRSGGGGRGRR